jgi:hypothetical protein
MIDKWQSHGDCFRARRQSHHYIFGERCLSSFRKQKTSERVQLRIQTAMDPYLAASYEAIRHTGNTIDYFRIVWDENTGTCLDCRRLIPST